MESDPIAGAALPEVVAKAPDGAVPLDAKGRPKEYASPMKYRGNEWAQKINGMLDNLSLSDSGLLATPAATVMVGECAMATGEALGMNTQSDKVPIHPGWLLLCAVVAFAGIIAFQHWQAKKSVAPAANEGASRLDGLA